MDRTTTRRAGPAARSEPIYPGPGFGMGLEHQAGAILLLNLRNLLLVWLFLVLTCCPREELGPERHPSDTPAASGSSRSPPWWPSASSPRTSGSGTCRSCQLPEWSGLLRLRTFNREPRTPVASCRNETTSFPGN